MLSRGAGGELQGVEPRVEFLLEDGVDGPVPLDGVHAVEGIGDDHDGEVGLVAVGLRVPVVHPLVKRVLRAVVVHHEVLALDLGGDLSLDGVAHADVLSSLVRRRADRGGHTSGAGLCGVARAGGGADRSRDGGDAGRHLCRIALKVMTRRPRVLLRK